jgi:hypothetical protein
MAQRIIRAGQTLTFVVQNKETKRKCREAITEWTRLAANRRSPKALCLRHFCEPPPSPTTAVNSPASTSTYGSTPSISTNNYESLASPATQSDMSVWWYSEHIDGQGCPGKSDPFFLPPNGGLLETCYRDSSILRHKAGTGGYCSSSLIFTEGNETTLPLHSQAAGFPPGQLRSTSSFIDTQQYLTYATSEVGTSTHGMAGSTCEEVWNLSHPLHPES